jgi:uncharacterized protein
LERVGARENSNPAKENISMKLIAIFAYLGAAALLSGMAHAQTLGIITTPTGSYSNSAGSAVAKVLVDKAKLRVVVQPQASAGFDEVDAGSAQFNMVNSFDATFAAAGTGEYQAQGPHKNLRIAATLIPYRVALHVRADSDIKTIADLKGKRVASGFNAQKTIGRLIEAHLGTAGLSYKDVISVPAPNVVRQADDFKAGKIDVLFFALGSAAVKEASASVGGLRVLEVPDSPEAMKRAQAVLPGSYLMKVDPSPALEGITRPTNLIAFDMVIVTNASVSDDVIYKVAKAIHDNKGELAETFRPFAQLTPQNMAKPIEGVPYHPGAVKYYREIGLIKP